VGEAWRWLSGVMKALTKAEREIVRLRCRGRCAYCGIQLGKNWHADHMEPVRRVFGQATHPERHTLDNLWPSCHRCNIDKWALSLKAWRAQLEDSCARLERNYGTYRHAVRFGQIVPRPRPIVFFFELNRRRIVV